MSLPNPDKPFVLVCAPNWIGDSIMSMPALQCFRRSHPDFHIALLVKSHLASLWQLHATPDEIMALPAGTPATLRMALLLRRRGFAQAYILPNSFRSAFVPWLAAIPERIGFAGHFRRALLTRVVARPRDPARQHQVWEYMALLCPNYAGFAQPEDPVLRIPTETAKAVGRLIGDGVTAYAVLMPGAARGPSKRWPADHFIALGKRLAVELGLTIVVCGAASEAKLCDAVARGVGSNALNLAGRTTLPEWAAVLAKARLVVCNDSGGMHLAAAVGAPVIALFGITDPAKTGPLGRHARVLQKSLERHRDVPRRSAEAAKWLASITPEQVYEEAWKIWRASGLTPNS